MTKLNRKTQKIFCSQGGSNQTVAFGTAKNENPTYTTDADLIQNPNFLAGWTPALLPDKAPFKEDSNSLFYLITRQLAYLFQEGIPEYDANTNYSQNAFVRGIGSANVYISLAPDNLGNPLNNPAYWKLYISDGSLAQYEIGKPEITLNNTLLSNEIWLEGQTVSRTQYANLFNIYGTTYGAGNGTSTFQLPDFRNRAIWGSNSFGYLNQTLPSATIPYSGWEVTGKHPGNITQGVLVAGSGQNERAETLESLTATNADVTVNLSGTFTPNAIKVRVKTRYY